jgi:hypothetical protein
LINYAGIFSSKENKKPLERITRGWRKEVRQG